MPQIEILEMKDDFGKVVISDATPEFVNSLRRAMISEVPKMAIHEVEFHMGPVRAKVDNEDRSYESMTPLFDEVLAHRLAMLPIPTKLDQFNFREECECGGEGCPKCTLMYSLNKRGPGTVYSGDLEPIGGDEFRIKPDLIPLVELDKDQAVLIYATAQLGTGKQHAKWQAAYAVAHKYYPVIDIEKKACTGCGKCVEMCPREVLELKNGKVAVRDGKLIDCTLCNSCVEECAKEGANAIKVTGDDTRFIMRYETDGSLKASEVLERALAILAGKYEELREKLSGAL